MTRIGIMAALLFLVGANRTHSRRADVTAAVSLGSELQPSPEMQRLIDTFSGNWTVGETFEVSASRQGKTRQGAASFRVGPGSQ